MTPAEIIQIIIGILSLFATVFISFFIYWLQTRHEKEIQRLEERQKQKELEDLSKVCKKYNMPLFLDGAV